MKGSVTPGENGELMPIGATPDAWADAIIRLVTDQQSYRRLCTRARDAYEQRLNWGSWADSVQRVVRGLGARPLVSEGDV
jgi:glycosyltransferase involved in cell wall biosynthesis